MPDFPGMPSSITCPSCGFENSTTSLYCQDCGVRLVAPPSSLVEQTPPETSGTETTSTTPRKKARIVSINREKSGPNLIVNTVLILIVAAIAALAILVFREPAGLPQEEAPLSADVIGNIRLGFSRNAQLGKPVNVPWTGQGMNAFIAGAVAAAHPGLAVMVAPADDNGFTLFVRHRIGSTHIYTTSTYHLISRGNGIGVVRTHATIGRLPVPSWASPAMEWADESVADSLAPDLDILRNATSVRTDAQQVRMSFGTPTQ